MTIEFISGRRRLPPRLLVYGPPKVGKSTFASESDDPLFISGEAGDTELDVKRYVFDKKTGRTHPITWTEVLDAVRAAKSGGAFKTVVFDGMTALEQLCVAHVCTTSKWKCLAEPGFGRGESLLLSEMRLFHKEVEDLWTKGIAIIFVTHSKLARVKNPEGDEYQRHEPALTSVNGGDVQGLFLGWVDAILFARPEVETAKLESKRVLGVATGRRLLHTEGTAAFVAGGRYGNVDPVLELSYAEFRRQMEEGQSPEKMRAKVAQLLKAVGPETAKRVTDWLATPAANNLSALTRAADALRREAEASASKHEQQASA
jgi:hypothetical protein